MTIKMAVLGMGRIARTRLLPGLDKAEEAVLWSVLSRDAERGQASAAKHKALGPTPAFTDLDALLADPELDAVIIASPDRVHVDQVVRAAAAGKHVLTEKPMAVSVAECDRMIAACDAAGVRLGVAYHMRWHAGHRLLHERVRAGDFGDIRHVRVQWNFSSEDDSNWRAREDLGKWWSLAATGTHCVDQVQWFLGGEVGDVVEVNSTIGRSVFDGPHDETALVSLRFGSGATAEICSSVVFAGPTRFELYGTKGFVVAENTMSVDGSGTIRTHEGPFPFEPVDPYAGEIDDFARAIADGRGAEVSGRQGRENIAVLCEACP